ncbi:hypothetical protein ASG31_00455 [Chryseobacterium sp. Leaf404]|uniref:hypothetical protein n=1 Tax=unclassified Chryseobacterium TaxID=2593645 RepID=UPI0006F35884|nr:MULTISPECIES: hypothetical protein [unclassified Chryseobacterium]KQT21852.1 hypothetical protein ASG31_00455 [Chryseobacterium sp. Leaf404]
MKKTFLAVSIICVLWSCATEKGNTSPVPGGSSTEKKTDGSGDISQKISENTNAAEISNLLSSFPVFSKKAVNEEISVLKYSLQNYLYALDAGNSTAKNRQLKNMQQSYRKIQKLRKSLSTDENDILNRYLVRIKTNIAVIENSVNANKK